MRARARQHIEVLGEPVLVLDQDPLVVAVVWVALRAVSRGHQVGDEAAQVGLLVEDAELAGARSRFVALVEELGMLLHEQVHGPVQGPSSFEEVLTHSALTSPLPSAQLAPTPPPPPVGGVGGVGWGALVTGGVEPEGVPAPPQALSTASDSNAVTLREPDIRTATQNLPGSTDRLHEPTGAPGPDGSGLRPLPSDNPTILGARKSPVKVISCNTLGVQRG